MEDNEDIEDDAPQSDEESLYDDFIESTPGPFMKRKYTPESLLAKFIEYAKWNNKHPLGEQKVFGTGLKMTAKKKRPMTEIAFLLFAGISRATFNMMEKGKPYEGSETTSNHLYMDTVIYIKDCIYRQKFEGGAAGFFNANIISRELGLVDKTQSVNINLVGDIADADVKRIADSLINDI